MSRDRDIWRFGYCVPTPGGSIQVLLRIVTDIFPQTYISFPAHKDRIITNLYEGMKYFLRGLFRLIIIVLLSPILIPIMVLDFIFMVGGKDPFNTPITPIKDWIGDIIFWD